MFRDSFLRGVSCFAVLLLCLSASRQPAAVFAQSGEGVQELKQKAAELTGQHKYTEALPVLQRLVIIEPDNPENHFYLGFALIAKANVTEDEAARKELRVRARAAFVRAKELGVQEPVVDALVQSIPPDGSDGVAFSRNVEANKLMLEAEGLYSRGRLDDALANYQKALRLDPNLYEAALFSGDVYTQRGDFEQAEAWYQKAIAIDPNRETAYRYSATPLMKQRKYDRALERYVEAFISEPYNSYSRAGLTLWAQTTGGTLAHPDIDIPVSVAFDEKGDAKIDLGAGATAGSGEDGSFAWVAYGAARSAWRKEKFAKTFPREKNYRHSLTEEANALRSVLKLAAGDKRVKRLSPSLAKLKKLDEEGLLEAYILLSRPDEGIAEDHRAYLAQNRDKLRRYVLEYIAAGANSARGVAAPGGADRLRHDEKIETEYDKAKDQTTLKLQMTPITCVRDGCVFFSLESSFAGQQPQAPAGRVVLALYIFTKTLEPFTDPALTALVDGEPFELGRMTFAGDESKDGLAGMAYGIILDEKAFAKLAKARRLEMRIGKLQFPFGENKLNAVADFYRRATSGRKEN